MIRKANAKEIRWFWIILFKASTITSFSFFHLLFYILDLLLEEPYLSRYWRVFMRLFRCFSVRICSIGRCGNNLASFLFLSPSLGLLFGCCLVCCLGWNLCQRLSWKKDLWLGGERWFCHHGKLEPGLKNLASVRNFWFVRDRRSLHSKLWRCCVNGIVSLSSCELKLGVTGYSDLPWLVRWRGQVYIIDVFELKDLLSELPVAMLAVVIKHLVEQSLHLIPVRIFNKLAVN